MRKVLLIDDEFDALDMLEYELLNLQEEVEICAKCADARDAVSLIETHQPDLLFLDIEMPWMNGFDVLDQIQSVDFDVIFVTAYNHYAVKAFRYFALDYILKPYDAEDLSRIFQRLEKKESNQGEDLVQLLHGFKNSMELHKMAIPTSDGFEYVGYDEIVRCQADSNYSKIFLSDGRSIVVSKPLKYLIEIIEDDAFFRVHQSHYINLNYLAKFIKQDGGLIVLKDKTEIPLSRNFKTGFMKRIYRS